MVPVVVTWMPTCSFVRPCSVLAAEFHHLYISTTIGLLVNLLFALCLIPDVRQRKVD